MVPAFSQKFWKIGMTHMRLKNPDDGLDMVVPLDIGKGLKEMRSAVIRSSELHAGSQFERRTAVPPTSSDIKI